MNTAMVTNPDPTRKRGILNERARKYLRGESDIEPKSDSGRAIRAAIRGYLKNSLLDFTELYGGKDDGTGIEPRDVRRVLEGDRDFDAGDVEPDIRAGFKSEDELDNLLTKTSAEMEEALVDAIAFLYTYAPDAGLSPKDLIKRGVERAERREHPEWLIEDVTVDVKKDTRDSLAMDALRKLQHDRNPDSLTNAEVRALLETGRGNITPENLAGFLQGDWEWPPDGTEVVEEGTDITDYIDDEDEEVTDE